MTFDLALLRKKGVTAQEIFPKISTNNYTIMDITTDYSEWLLAINTHELAREKDELRKKLIEIYQSIPVRNHSDVSPVTKEPLEDYDSESTDYTESLSTESEFESDSESDNQDSSSSSVDDEEEDKNSDIDDRGYDTCPEPEPNSNTNQVHANVTIPTNSNTLVIEEIPAPMVLPNRNNPTSLIAFFAEEANRSAAMVKKLNLAEFPNTLIAACVLVWPDIMANVNAETMVNVRKGLPQEQAFTDFFNAMDSVEVSFAQDGAIIFEAIITVILITALVITLVYAAPLPIVLTVAAGLFFFIGMDGYSLGNRYSLEHKADEINANYGRRAKLFPPVGDGTTNNSPAVNDNTVEPDSSATPNNNP